MFGFLLATIIFFLFPVYWIICTRRPKNYPPGPKWLPIVGNTSLLRSEARKVDGQQYLVFKQWMEKYNSPVIGLKLGRELVVVAMTYPIIHEVHTNETFDGRPDNFFLRLRTMGSRLGITCTDGEFWSEQRNFVVKHLRLAGYGRQPMEIQIQNELNELIEVIDEKNGEALWPGSLIPPSVINVLWKFTAGKKIPRSDEQLMKLLNLMQQRSKAFDMSGGWLNSMPFLRFIAPEITSYNLIKRFNIELCEFFRSIIDAHKAEFTVEKSADDLIFAYINEMKSRESLPSNFTDLQLTMIILDMFIAGSQTTSITLDLALMMMVIRPDIQTKVQQEIDQVLGEAQLPLLSDKSELSYIEAVLLETGRYFHIVPTSGPRRVLQTTTLGGYTIPKDATVLIGLHTIQKDKSYWNDPDVFRPERFLDENQKITNIERFVAFGQGRRRCLGENLARACLFTFFVGIMQKYEIELPVDGRLPSLQTLPGIVLSPQEYKVVFKRRQIDIANTQ